MNKQTVKGHTRINKFKTSSLVVTAVQPSAAIRETSGAVKKNKKTKSIQTKLPSNNKISNKSNVNAIENRRQSIQNATNSGNSGEGVLMSAATATTIVRKVKTKLKKKKSTTIT